MKVDEMLKSLKTPEEVRAANAMLDYLKNDHYLDSYDYSVKTLKIFLDLRENEIIDDMRVEAVRFWTH